MAKKKQKPQSAPEQPTEVEAVEEPVQEPTEAAETTPEAEAPVEPSNEEKLEAELKSQKDKYMRLYAEYDNYRKRTSAEKLQIYDDATAKAIKELLPLADSMAQALAQFEGKEVPEEFKKGIELIAAQLKQSFDKLKIETFGEAGDPFDPELHNAVSMVEDDSLGENCISAVYQKGYRIGDRIIRHAMVVVANA